MVIQGSRVLILGGWGLVGSAICHKILQYSPSKLIVSSLRKSEAEEAVNQLRKEYKNYEPETFEARWGNIFTRTEWKDEYWWDIISVPEKRKNVVKDIFFELDNQILTQSALYNLIIETKPDIIVDCINTATAIAYLNIYNTTLDVIAAIENGNVDEAMVEKLIASTYIPQLIRHIQILYHSLIRAGTKEYLKIGTSGTGGMGMNIPYTHSEERPSRVLLSKAAVAGAQSLLLFLLARTPGGPIIKEIKPTAAIAWKRIAYDKVKKGGNSITLFDMPIEKALSTDNLFNVNDNTGVINTGKEYKSVFIDTGENGIFSKGEFQAISSLGQMEIITPEEIAGYVVFELLGGNSGHDIIQGLDSFSLGPSYRGGMLQNVAIQKMTQLESQFNVDSVAFELLGPPRLSKLLFEANILKKVAGSMYEILNWNEKDLANEANKLISSDNNLRQQILSIGLVILLADGKHYLRGKNIKIPTSREGFEININEETLERWCFEGWVDLRKENFKKWKERIGKIIEQTKAIPPDETSSRYTYTRDYWNDFKEINEGKIAGWIFEFEESGWRFKR